MGLELAWEPLTIFGAIAALMFLGFAGQLLFSRLRVNDTLVLIGVGVLLGPVLGVIPLGPVERVRAFVGPLALILILFDGGLALRFRDLLTSLASATVLSVTGFAVTAAGVGIVAAQALDLPFTTGLILGATLGGTSAVVVMPSLQHMRAEKKTATTLNLESAITDVLVVVVAFTFISIVALGQGLSAQDVASTLLITFAMSVFIGITAGLLWLWLVPGVRDRPYGYMLTLGVMFALYVFVEWLLEDVSSGGGPLAVLAFGILLGNAQSLGGTLRERVGEAFVQGIRRFQGEIAFLVRTFFFVYLGLLVDPRLLVDTYTLAVGVLIFVVILAARYIAVVVTERRLRLSGDTAILWVMMPRGLAAAVLAAVPSNPPYSIPGTDRFVALAFIILVLTNLATTVGAFAIERAQERDPGGRLARAARKERRKERKKGRKAGGRTSDRDIGQEVDRAVSRKRDGDEIEFTEEKRSKKARDGPRRKDKK